MQRLATILANLLAAIAYVVLKNFKMTCIIALALGLSILLYCLATTYGRYPVPYPLLFVLLGTIIIVSNLK